MQDKPLRLTIELVPEPCWYKNMRKELTRSQWDALRKSVYAQYSHRCGVCDAQGTLYCHEVWDYDDSEHIQRLAGFIALCQMCSHIKHIGHARILANEGKLDYEAVVEHFMRVNGYDKEAFERYRGEAFTQWRERNQYEWTTELGSYRELVDKSHDPRP